MEIGLQSEGRSFFKVFLCIFSLLIADFIKNLQKNF